MLHTQQRQSHVYSTSWESPSDQLAQKFHLYDKNKDGILDKTEFRSLLKEVFSSQKSTQFLDDAIEETVWRLPNPDLEAVKQAILSIGDTLQLTSKSKQPNPFNAQGQQMLPPPTTTTTTTTSTIPTTTTNTPFNPFNPFMSTQPTSSLRKQESAPFVDPRALPLPPPIAPTEIKPIPPPPNSNLGSFKRPLPPRTTDVAAPAPKGVPMKQQPVMAKLPAKLPAKAAARAAPMAARTTTTTPSNTMSTPMAPMSAPIPSSKSLDQPIAPVRMFPQGSVLSHPPLSSTSGISEEESRAFVEYINTNVALQQDNDVKPFLPISTNSQQIYSIVSDGWLLCKLLNSIQPNIIPLSQIKLHPKNAFEKIENHNLAIQAAKKLGCKVINIGPEDLLQGKPRLVLGLLWQIIKRDVLSKVSLAQHPEIYKLAKSSNNLKEISDSSPEEVLLKWANHHLRNANGGSITNFSKDLKDGTTYALLMNQIAPEVCSIAPVRESNVHKRAQMIVENAKKLNCARFITASDIVNGNEKLNLAFVADLFNKHSGLALPTLDEMEKLKKQNASLSSVLDEAEARLKQILADGQLAHELQQEEILMYRQRKLKEQEQLAEQEAMLRAQVQREEMMLVQEQRMKDMSLQEQERFAREEQRKEDQRGGKRLSSSGSMVKSSSLSSSGSLSKNNLSSSGSYSKSSFAYSSSEAAQGTSAFVSASLPPSSSSSSYHPPPPSHSTTTTPAPYSSGGNIYSDSAVPAYAQSYTTSTTSSGPSSYSYSSEPAHGPYSASYAPQPPGPSSSYGHSSNYNAPPSHYPPNLYPAPAPAPQYSEPNPYNVGSYPPAPYPESSSSYTSTQTTYTEPPPVSSYPDEMSPVVRHRGLFERFGKKIDKAFH